MSFSADVKMELSKMNNLADKRCVKWEFFGYAMSNNVSIVDKLLRFSTENEYNINRFGKLLSNLNNNDYQIEMQGKSYVIITKEQDIIQMIENDMDSILSGKTDIEERAMIRGCFLGSGSINNPQNNYHIEILLKTKENADFLLKSLQQFGISFKLLNRMGSYCIYSKDGEEISKFLAFIGANKSVLKFEDIRVYRDMRNNVNRLVNCETANLSKTVSAAFKQIEAIKQIKQKNKYEEMPENLKEMAELRVKYPEVSLVELGKMLNPPIGKSGVNHRLKAIVQLANDLE